jgi:AraC-like DNA-binding protein
VRTPHRLESIHGHTFSVAAGRRSIDADERGLGEEERRLPLAIHSSGVSRWADADSYTWTSSLLSINLITAGDARYEQEGRHGAAAVGDVVLMHKGCRHTLRTGAAGRMHHRYVRIEGRAAEPALRAAGLLDVDSLRPRAPERVLGLMREAHRLLADKPAGYYPRLALVAYALVVECAQAIPRELSGPMARALDCISRNSDRAVSLDEMARAAQVSRRTCSRMFLKRFGRSPVRHAAARRMSVAAEMLRGTTLSAKQVGAAVGYPDPSHFTLVFRRHYGLSPRKYRLAAQPKPAWE